MLRTTVEATAVLLRGQYMIMAGGYLSTLHIWPSSQADQDWLMANRWHLYDTDFDCLVVHALDGASLIRFYDFGEAQRRNFAIQALMMVLR